MFKIKARVASLAALAVLTLPVLAACGGETATSTAVPAPTGTTAPAAAATDTPAAAAADTPATSAATPTEAVAGMTPTAVMTGTTGSAMGLEGLAAEGIKPDPSA